MSMSSPRRRLAALATVALATAGLTVTTPSASGQGNPHVVEAKTRVHWANGKALGATNGKGADAVRGYLAAQGRATADSLRASGSWTAKGVTYLRLQQYAGGLRVVDSDVKAALDKQGRLISVVENTSKVRTPSAARATAAQARSAAIDSIYGGKAVTYLQAPSVERVAAPMSDGTLAEAFEVTTWDSDNQLLETLVDGSGAVVRTVSRTAEDGYNIFPEDPDKGPQELVSNPADLVASPNGWLTGTQYVDDITGNNAHAYRDANSDNKPDPVGAADNDGVFDKVFNPTTQPTEGDNQAVAVQNLFFLNNKIHDLLYRAGFTPAAGNFQADTYGQGGRGGDPVLAEAQDGGGTDNANFATPKDGTSGRMQMYLWSVPGTSEVVQNGISYNAPVAEFSAPLTVDGVTGPLALATDGAGVSPTDACENIAAVPAGSFVVADRGNCDFVLKAANIKAAGAGGMIVANNVADGAPFVMGGTVRKFGLPAVMVSQADGAAIKANVGTATTISLVDPAPPMRDGDLDSDIVYHEYGHGLTWRMIGQMSGAVAGGIGEGMGDALSIIINNDPVVGEYSFSDPIGIRSESYEGFSRTYAEIPFTEVHDTGELYGAITWDLWKRYQGAGLGQSDILFDLVQGMNFTPAKPTFEQMREGILAGLAANGTSATRSCLVSRAFAAYGVGVGSSAKVSGGGATVVESFAVPAGC